MHSAPGSAAEAEREAALKEERSKHSIDAKEADGIQDSMMRTIDSLELQLRQSQVRQCFSAVHSVFLLSAAHCAHYHPLQDKHVASEQDLAAMQAEARQLRLELHSSSATFERALASWGEERSKAVKEKRIVEKQLMQLRGCVAEARVHMGFTSAKVCSVRAM